MRGKKINILSLYKTYVHETKENKETKKRAEPLRTRCHSHTEFDWHVISGKFSVERPQKTAQSYKDKDKLKKEAL